MLHQFLLFNLTRFKISCVLPLLMSLLYVHALSQQVTQAELEMAKTVLEQEREVVFIEALHLSVSQATVFHPIYVEFSREKRALDDLLINLFVQYSKNYNTLDPKVMRDFIKHSKEHQRKEMRIRKKYYKKLGKAISAELASQFYEVDDFLSTMLRINVLAELPFTSSIVKQVKK